ncbi:MAG: hypothetical protein J3K34DRAFT_150486 [Monoraphidium minutum]|nr:MAG: hypothetical protein J3K34DRAFT_150486 [Monoraphidium minutum]
MRQGVRARPGRQWRWGVAKQAGARREGPAGGPKRVAARARPRARRTPHGGSGAGAAPVGAGNGGAAPRRWRGKQEVSGGKGVAPIIPVLRWDHHANGELRAGKCRHACATLMLASGGAGWRVCVARQRSKRVGAWCADKTCRAPGGAPGGGGVGPLPTATTDARPPAQGLPKRVGETAGRRQRVLGSEDGFMKEGGRGWVRARKSAPILSRLCAPAHVCAVPET